MPDQDGVALNSICHPPPEDLIVKVQAALNNGTRDEAIRIIELVWTENFMDSDISEEGLEDIEIDILTHCPVCGRLKDA